MPRRIARVLDSNGYASGGYSSEFYVYDGADVILDLADADGPGGTATPEISHRYLHGPLVDQVLMQENVSGGSVTGVLWMLADNQGTVRDLLNSSGQHVEHIKYDSFGNIVEVTDGGGTPTSGPSTRYTYTGREWDAAVDMYFYRARWYDPHTGRFAGEDPINLLGGDYNFYRYVGNSPTNGTDPSGTQIGHPGSGDSISRSIWHKLGTGDFRGAWQILDDVARNIDPNCARQLKSAIKQIENLDKWRKQVSKLKQVDVKSQIKTLQKTLAKHLEDRGGCHTPETWRIQYQINFLKSLIK